MLIIMNGAMMPIDGTYIKKTISSNEAKKLFLKYKDDYISYIGYPNSCKVLSQLFNVQISLNRDRTIIKEGDIILAMQLNYRIMDTNSKSTRKHGDNLEDYQFSKIIFTS